MPRAKGQTGVMNPNSLKNLKQYKNISDTELGDVISDIKVGTSEKELTAMIEKEYKKYEQSYDLSDLMPNDIATLRALILANIRLNNYERELNRIEALGISDMNIILTEKLSKVCNDLRASMGSLQDTLKISRKVRRSEKEQSVLAFLDDMKVKANTFYHAKMIYIFCPKCNNLLGTIWLQYQDTNQNKMSLYCAKCGDAHSINIVETIKNKRSSNRPELLPVSMK